jgi:hypothetical protein
MPRREAASVLFSRPGVPEPEAVTGSLLRSVKVDRSIAEGVPGTSALAPSNGRAAAIAVGLLIALAAGVVYWVSNPAHWNQYNHFVWQADAFLHGRAWFYETADNDYLQDVFPLVDAAGNPTGRLLLPFPPLPALVLLPFVAVWGLATDQEGLAIILAALGVALAWWMLGGLRIRTSVRAATVVIFATGTAWWWAAAVGSTWYFAHLVAVDIALVAVGIALRNDARAADETPWDEDDREGERLAALDRPDSVLERIKDGIWPLDRSQVLVGFLLGVAATARLPLVFAAPFFILTGGGGSRVRRTASAAVGGIVPIAALLLYTYATTGSFLHPGYDYQYQLEANGYPALNYNPEWSVEDARYIPQNTLIMFGGMPSLFPNWMPNTTGYATPVELCTAPGAIRGLFDKACPIAVPVDTGTSILLSAPGLLLALVAVRRLGMRRVVIGSAAGVAVVLVFNLAHFSQGWVQWGYRFSLDFIPFLLPLVALGAGRPGDGRLRLGAAVLIVVGGAINLWGVTWGRLLGW